MRSVSLQPVRSGRSFLKWAGGKTRYARTLADIAPDFPGRYWEPFMGSAAVYFELRPPTATLSDANEELVTCFRVVAREPEAVMRLLDERPNTPAYFESVRRQRPADLTDLERAVRVIYLNKTSFRGLWRVNRKGQFNAPYGAYDRPCYNRETLLGAAKALRDVEIVAADYEAQIDKASAGDFVYLDPPYVPLGGWADFKRYTAGQFGRADHVRLRDAMKRASDRGVLVTLSNSETPFVRELFEADFSIARMATRRDINLQSAKRECWDLVITNYEVASPHG